MIRHAFNNNNGPLPYKLDVIHVYVTILYILRDSMNNRTFYNNVGWLPVTSGAAEWVVGVEPSGNGWYADSGTASKIWYAFGGTVCDSLLFETQFYSIYQYSGLFVENGGRHTCSALNVDVSPFILDSLCDVTSGEFDVACCRPTAACWALLCVRSWCVRFARSPMWSLVI